MNYENLLKPLTVLSTCTPSSLLYFLAAACFHKHTAYLPISNLIDNYGDCSSSGFSPAQILLETAHLCS